MKSEISSCSSGSSSKAWHKVNGVPKACWCGASLVIKLSNTEHNPFRRYFRCSMAASQKLVNDKHVFKWLDEALMNEVETFGNSLARVEKEMKEIGAYMEEHHKLKIEKLEEKIRATNRRMKITMGCAILVCVFGIIIMKFV